MKCPVCDEPLSISSREGVEIDFCPQCRGVWLDRGELDKILDRITANTPAPASLPPSPPAQRFDLPGQPHHDDRDRYRDRDRDRDRDRYDDRDRDRDRDRYDDRDRRYGGDRDRDRYDYKRKKKNPASFLEDLFDF
ncbi:MAG: zf-TFIIB domain-containing protein [Acidimicrobiales bacterium]|nr:zf-TFIIB domain-containing protein [Acidimicrobiales bacterium]